MPSGAGLLPAREWREARCFVGLAVERAGSGAGNGGAPLTGTANYGFGLVSQRADGALNVDVIDDSTGLADSAFHFAAKADCTAAP
jgi:hypothetical protein